MRTESSRRLLYALTGSPGSGKTTAILRIADELRRRGLRVGGMYTQELRERGRRVGFAVKRIGGGEGILAHVKLAGGPRHGKYFVNLHDLEKIGVSAILEGMREAEVVIVDEVGPMELYSEEFRRAVNQLLSSPRHAILTVHHRSRDPLALKVRRMAGENLIILTPENRDRIPSLIVERFLEAIRGR